MSNVLIAKASSKYSYTSNIKRLLPYNLGIIKREQVNILLFNSTLFSIEL